MVSAEIFLGEHILRNGFPQEKQNFANDEQNEQNFDEIRQNLPQISGSSEICWGQFAPQMVGA